MKKPSSHDTRGAIKKSVYSIAKLQHQRNKKITKVTRILEYFEQGKSLSPFEAFDRFTVQNLANRIYELRRKGHIIVTTIQKLNLGSCYGEYRLDPNEGGNQCPH